jgi:DNA-binding transcriptional ArsR family regulator
MAYTKVTEFSIEEQELAKFAKALSHPARIAIVNLLFKKGLCICGDIVEELPLSQSTVSQHLKELKNAGIIYGEIDGPRVCYCIDEEVWTKFDTIFRSFLNRN